MQKISVSITCGVGSERHNHNEKYRQKLDHIQTEEYARVCELTPYKSYKDQINEMMKPFIDEYNQNQIQRYNEAWERYNSGQIKTKPRKSNYKSMGYDYYEEHKNDTYYNRKTNKNEPLPIYRSIIIGLGDQNDKLNGVMSEDEAKKVFQGIVDKWSKMYPNLKLLGATFHTERGYHHAHFDYCCVTPIDQSQQKQAQGLAVSVSQEKAFESMGFTPEQSIINGRDKAPLLFNCFRNKLYYAVENELNKNNFLMLYNATKIKQPGKDSSKNMDKTTWQEFQDQACRMQELRNKVTEIFADDVDAFNGLNDFVKTQEEIQKTIETIENQPRSRINKDNVVVHFNLFDQFKSFLDNLLNSIAIFSKRLSEMEELLKSKIIESNELERRNDDQKNLIASLQKSNESLQQQARENELRRQYMETITNDNGLTANDIFNKRYKFDGHDGTDVHADR